MKVPLKNEHENYITDPTVESVADPAYWYGGVTKNNEPKGKMKQPVRLRLFASECWQGDIEVGVLCEETFLLLGRGRSEHTAFMAAARRLQTMAREAEKKAGKQ